MYPNLTDILRNDSGVGYNEACASRGPTAHPLAHDFKAYRWTVRWCSRTTVCGKNKRRNVILLPTIVQTWRVRLSTQLSSPYREPVIIGLLALVIGVIGGVGAIIFRDLINVFYNLFHAGHTGTSPLRALIPAVGLTIVGFITHYFAKEVKGHGVPQILESLALRGGKIRPRVAFFGILAPAITIGAGGSVGREGPIALIVGAFGSIVGQTLRLSDKYTSLLLACGSAAGIAATFNAPIAGGFFGLEVILGSYSMGAIMPVFLSAVTGATVFDAIMGSQPPLQTAPYHVIHPIALLFMILLGALAGFLGLAYSRGLTWIEDVFHGWNVPFWVKTSLGGLAVGALGLAFPQVLGVGYPSIHAALSGQLTIGLLLVLFLSKYIATLTTVGSGGSGGVFAPSLFLGSMVGGAFGEGLQRLVPGLIPHPQIYAIAGMGAIFAAAAQAPFVAITILLEVTGDYQLTPVVMAACVTAYVVHGVLSRDSMYTVKLTRRGIRILSGNEVRPTERIQVRTAMEPLDTVLELTDTVEKAFHVLSLAREHETVVTNAEGRLVGVLALSDLREKLNKGDLTAVIADLVPMSPPTVHPYQNLEDALRLFSLHDTDFLPVIDSQTQTVVGVLTQRDVVRSYNASTLHSTTLNARVRQVQRESHEPGQFSSVRLTSKGTAAGKTLADLRLPKGVVLVSIERSGKVLAPNGQTQLQVDDEALLFILPVSMTEQVLRLFRG